MPEAMHSFFARIAPSAVHGGYLFVVVNEVCGHARADGDRGASDCRRVLRRSRVFFFIPFNARCLACIGG